MAWDIIIAQFILHVMIVIMWDVVLLPLLFSLSVILSLMTKEVCFQTADLQ
jgi:uncharacterized membrane protein